MRWCRSIVHIYIDWICEGPHGSWHSLDLRILFSSLWLSVSPESAVWQQDFRGGYDLEPREGKIWGSPTRVLLIAIPVAGSGERDPVVHTA
ncbi:hypothetical protein R1flu_017691 [Riccia fluitans]|uniref:Uncharacterized protein n=1 Tax=Riccia fluitans TaxID=41844 RepID=A0ABD1ZDY7_9MARC